MRLKKLSLKNVMSHRDTEIDLNKLTILTGVSNSGKSVFIRALRLLLENKPSGIDLMSHFAKRGESMSVSVECEDDEGNSHTIERIRSKSKNDYVLDGKTLKAFGSDVPESITRITRLSDVTFQNQSDPNFMLSMTDGEVSRLIASVVGLNEIDRAFSALNSMKKENDANLKAAEVGYATENARLQKFSGVDNAVKTVESLVPIENDLVSATNAYKDIDTFYSVNGDFLEKVFEDLTEKISRINELEKFISNEKIPSYVSQTEELMWIDKTVVFLRNLSVCSNSDLEKIEKYFSEIVELMKSYKFSNDEIERMNEMISDVESISEKVSDSFDVDDAVRDFMKLCSELTSKVETVESDVERYNDVSEFVSEIGEIVSECRESEAIVSDYEEEFKEWLKTHPVCPQCGAEQKHWSKNLLSNV